MSAESSRPPGGFPTTHWSLVARAGHDAGPPRREALGELLIAYLPALKAHLIYGKRLPPEQADDLLQEFIAGKILEKDLIGRAEQELGKFRTFLLTALDRFFLNRIRDEQAKKRAAADGAVALGDRAALLEAPPGPENAYEVAWARGIVDEAMSRMRRDCEEGGRPEVWGVFECRVARPILDGTEPIDYGELIRRFDLRSPTQASNVLITGKRMYARALRAVVGRYAGDHDEIESELEELRRILSAA